METGEPTAPDDRRVKAGGRTAAAHEDGKGSSAGGGNAAAVVVAAGGYRTEILSVGWYFGQIVPSLSGLPVSHPRRAGWNEAVSS